MCFNPMSSDQDFNKTRLVELDKSTVSDDSLTDLVVASAKEQLATLGRDHHLITGHVIQQLVKPTFRVLATEVAGLKANAASQVYLQVDSPLFKPRVFELGSIPKWQRSIFYNFSYINYQWNPTWYNHHLKKDTFFKYPPLIKDPFSGFCQSSLISLCMFACTVNTCLWFAPKNLILNGSGCFGFFDF